MATVTRRHGAASPGVRDGAVVRARLQAELSSSGADVVALIAPAGYGKTTALAGWAQHDGRPVAWLSLDRTHEDPAVLLSDVARTLDGVIGLDPSLMRRIDSAGDSASLSSIRHLTRALEDTLEVTGERLVLVLDDIHVVTDQRGNDLVSALIEHLPKGSCLAMSARETPILPLARFRSHGRLLELGPDDLAMDDQEARALFESAGLELSAEAVGAINARAEGWPAGLYLAALSLRSGGDPTRSTTPLDDRLITAYVREELLDRLPDDLVTFLTRTSVLDRFCADLCHAVADTDAAAELLAEQERSNHFLVAIDVRPGWFRFHQLFREVLQAELHRREAGSIPGLHAKAAAWLEANGSVEEAIAHAHAAGNELEAARLVSSVGRAFGGNGRLLTVQRWLGAFDEATIAAYPPLALLQAWVLAYQGDPAASRWADIAERGSFVGLMPDRSASLTSAVALVRALLASEGPKRMLLDATTAVEAEPPESPWRAGALVLLGVALVLNGKLEDASRRFEEATAAAGPSQATASSTAWAWQALLAADGRNWDRAMLCIERARSIADGAGLGDAAPQILMFATSAFVHLHRGDTIHAAEELAHAHRLRPASSTAIAWLGVQARLVMARTHIASDDVAGARLVLREAREIASRGPDIGALSTSLDDLEERMRSLRHDGAVGSTALTAAELRILGLLPTHLSFREIAERLFVSRNTVKTQAISVYRKLAVASRSEAVSRGRALGLIDD